MSRRFRRPLLAALALPLAGLALATPQGGHAQGSLGFAAPVFVDRTLGGGEPFVSYSPVSKQLVYTSHEGTTHIFSKQALVSPAESGGFVANYANQVNVWTSADNGASWKRVSYLAQFFQSPTQNTGFSDPDLTQDEGGRIYNTDINLANDSLFSSKDGGLTWDTGTVQCHEGDRPWLAGGKKDEVFLSTDSSQLGHIIVHSTDGGGSCASTTIGDTGGVGKLFYDHGRGQLVEPAIMSDGSLGLGILPNATNAFGSTPGTFTQKKVAPLPNGIFAHWPAMSIDSAGNYYMVWDTNDRIAGTTGGCGTQGAQQITGTVGLSSVENLSPAANSVLMSSSTDGGQTWSAPLTVGHVAGHRLLWPWITAGDPGRVAVTWYQYDQLVDPNCAPADSNVSVQVAELTNALTPASATEAVVTAGARAIHSGPICQGGTFCAALNVATNEDRRLGDFSTVSTDRNGCILVATADTTLLDPVTQMQSPVSHPLFVRQNSGPSLTGADCAAGTGTTPAPGVTASGGGGTTPTTATTSGLANTSGIAASGPGVALATLAVGAGVLAGSRRRRRAD